jgi:hypothetical protein
VGVKNMVRKWWVAPILYVLVPALFFILGDVSVKVSFPTLCGLPCEPALGKPP